MSKQPFYIIGHNPNKEIEFKQYLIDGANALEPDIHYHPQKHIFYVSHDSDDDLKNSLTLSDYFSKLKTFLIDPKSNIKNELALISFDLKPPYTYDLMMLYSIIRSEFSKYFPKIAIL